MTNKSLSKLRLAAGVASIVVSSLLSATAAQAAAEIVIVNGNDDGVGFNDPTPVAPVGGNTGTTLGEQRLIAFEAAAAKWGATLNSTVQIRVLAGFLPLACTATGAVLGSAGANFVHVNDPSFPKQNTLYPDALADKLSGVDQIPLTDEEFTWDITARFNVNLGQATCLAGSPFYLGLDNKHGASVDLVTVLLHEFGHGLGFQTFTNASTGAQLAGFPSIWDHFLLDNATGLLWRQMTNAQRAASSISVTNLVWSGVNVTNNAPLVLAAPRLVVSGSAAGATAGTHAVGTAGFGPPVGNTALVTDIMPVSAQPVAGEGCNPFSAIDKLAANGNIVLISRGVCGFVVKVKNAQNAGAVGVIIANNAAAQPPPGLGGGDGSITIPTLSVTLEDGNALRAATSKRSRTKSGVIGSMFLDHSAMAGTDPSGLVRMFAPNPFQSGSSVSHFDVSAYLNLLMEPNINGDLTHEVTPPYDLTLPLLKDIGW